MSLSKRALQQSLHRMLQQFSLMMSVFSKADKVHVPKIPVVRSMSSSSHITSSSFWKKVSLFVAMPLLGAVGTSVMMSRANEECPERPPFVKYEFMRKRTKRFPWGDGMKTFFHNPEKNALPEGYEDEI